MRFYLQRIKNIYHLVQAVLANWYYGVPSKKLTVIGITGTDGKTTTSSLIYHILKTSGKRVSALTTVAAQIGITSYDTGFHVTTPDAFAVQRYLRQAVTDGDQYFVLETTSHALDQYRVYGVDFAYGIVTNITHEHLHYHGTFAHYVQSKARLLKWSRVCILNRDDAAFPVLKNCCIDDEMITYGLSSDATYHFAIAEKIGKPLARFNVYNYLAAYAVCLSMGLSDKQIFAAMKTYQLPPGRMELVYDTELTVIVDFAHTPHALHEVLESIRTEYGNKRRLIHVFGAAAFRDDSKRPLMGEESGTYADLTILTEEDYRTEDPEKICRQIAIGLKTKGFTLVDPAQFADRNKQYTVIINRNDAITRAIQVAQKGDIIVITGKGHEKSLNRKGKEYPWDDKKAVREALEKKSYTLR